MQPFHYLRATDVRGAIDAGRRPGAEFVAGGTDMLQLLKDDVRRPDWVVDIGRLDLAEIVDTPQGLRLGAMARMARGPDDERIRKAYPVIAQALAASAAPQVRNAATIGGN